MEKLLPGKHDPYAAPTAALDGLGLAYVFEEDVADYLARGELVRVLEDWCPPFEGIQQRSLVS